MNSELFSNLLLSAFTLWDYEIINREEYHKIAEAICEAEKSSYTEKEHYKRMMEEAK